ncbi:TetR/AcrR family transcriptional regulator [Kurthia sibirica]|uniref:TetR/AcrR family transcriptional regulator n=1 Tax=Kurthia sibirica TaxID=202750 RepID=UPI001168891D|nr:TetR/AcrR family transcriptional regulator [Kurthia sibirica]GEK32981.1 TetR family transcriptional regulator [Kurthia sibirica]
MAVDTKEKIIAIATDLFRKKGYLGVGLSELLKVCELSKGAFYHHFPAGKEELLITCLRTMNKMITNDMKKIFAQYDTTTEAIDNMLSELIRQYERDKVIIGYTFNSIVSEMGSVSEVVRQTCEESYDAIQAIYQEKLSADGFSHQQASDQALLLNATIEGAIMLSLTKHSSIPLQTVARLLSISTHQHK